MNTLGSCSTSGDFRLQRRLLDPHKFKRSSPFSSNARPGNGIAFDEVLYKHSNLQICSESFTTCALSSSGGGHDYLTHV